ncbi:hypothetical protein M0R45_024830 [Rubus argutus]|uniref:Oleosin n=1 Tax=Rubus argutus TaxID=59490 RepID=A0AAW1WTM7_RUBAR
MAQNPETQHNLAYQMVQASTALTFGGSLSVLSGLTLTAAIICLTAVTPLLVIFSPVLVPAAIAMLLLATGFFSSGGLGVTAAFCVLLAAQLCSRKAPSWCRTGLISWLQNWRGGHQGPSSAVRSAPRKWFTR